MDYFELLNCSKQYKIDKNELNKNYLSLQNLHHPDKHYSKDNNILSIELNKAYQTLKDDVKRAEYLLSLQSDYYKEASIVSGDFLEKTLEEFERIELIQDESEINKFYKNKLIEQQKMVASLEDAFAEHMLQQALDLTMRLKYLNRIIENIKLKITNADY